MLILQLLHYAAAGMPAEGSGPVCASLEAASPAEVDYALEAGLGPLLHRATRACTDRLPPPLSNALISADLTAQVRHQGLVDAAKAAIDICTASSAQVVLLKGISISGQCYPAGHLRPMSDVDVLIPAASCEAVQAAFLRHGYEESPDRMKPNSHHGQPLLDPQRHIWIELHTALFPAASPLTEGRVFSTPGIFDQRVDADLEGRAASRLSNELQLAYIASYWVRDISMHGIHPGFVMPVLDAVCLLGSPNRSLDWDRLLAILDNPLAVASLLILLGYLSRYGVIRVPPGILGRLSAAQTILGRPERAILAAMVHSNLIGGRPFRPVRSWHVWSNLIRPGSPLAKLLTLPWNILFPPSRPERYNPAWQAARFARRLRRAFGPESRARVIEG